MKTMVSVFNDLFFDFLTDILRVFPDDVEILTAQNALLQIRKVNPKLILKIWRAYIIDKYSQEIEAGSIDFFVDKDYSLDINGTDNSDKIMGFINRLREPIRNMSSDDQLIIMKYMQNLSKISILCN
tara:strand:+ start:17655 stop:18035 length:381 start_codon:yes stop_codon:yes gene_type:complete